MFHSTLLGVPETFSSLFLTVTATCSETTLEPMQFFTEHGSSASQMKAAKIIDVIARLPGCDAQAADAVSANSQVKLEDAPRMLKIPSSECSDVWIRLPKHKCPNHGPVWKIPWYLLNEICTVLQEPDCYGGDNTNKPWMGENSEL